MLKLPHISVSVTDVIAKSPDDTLADEIERVVPPVSLMPALT